MSRPKSDSHQQTSLPLEEGRTGRIVVETKGLIVVLILVPVALAGFGCESAKGPGPAEEGPPVKIERSQGGDQVKMTLTAHAAQRLGIETEPVRRTSKETLIPLTALVYGQDGDISVYVNPAPLTYLRQRVTIGRVEGGTAVLQSGPAVGSAVVTVGTPELYGIEDGVDGQ